MDIVEARAVVKTYDSGSVRVQALRGIDLSLRRGEMASIMGPSGCGKTTLLNCLSGLDAVDGGDVLIEGVPLSAMSDRERTDYRARRMGFVFQYYNLMPVLTAVENVELPLLVTRVGAAEARRRAFEALELVGIPQRARHLPEQLSGGERPIVRARHSRRPIERASGCRTERRSPCARRGTAFGRGPTCWRATHLRCGCPRRRWSRSLTGS